MKNWDACQFGMFTVHGSGHNPRDTQPKRYRQRIAHKFKYYHDKFDEILCTAAADVPAAARLELILPKLQPKFLILSEAKYLLQSN
jgi:hypothetical protein